MSSPSILNYSRDVSLVDRTDNLNVTYVSEGVLTAVKNNLDEYFLKCEITNSGNVLTDNCRITLRIDAVGTFIRADPILVNENSKLKYLIDFQLHQGSDDGKLFRFEISQAIIQEDENFGEVLVIVGRGREYIFKENISSRSLFFKTPNEAFTDRLVDFAANTPLGDGPSLGNVTNDLPTSPKQNWIPTGPQTIQRSIEKILDRVALPATSGGTLRDFYWDSDPQTGAIQFIDIQCREFGTLPIADGDRVEINPEKDTESEQKDKQVVTDSQSYKNQIILRGSPSHGTLPMEHTRFASNFEHARRRDEWVSGTSYVVDNLVRRRIDAGVSGEQHLFRYFKSRTIHSSATLPELDLTNWLEDFTQYSQFIQNGSYEKGVIVYDTPSGNRQFFQCKNDVKADDAFDFGTLSFPEFDATNWQSFSGSRAPADFTDFKSFSPWTNDHTIWLANMMDNATPLAPFKGGFVDWNFVRANYDAANFTNQYGHLTHKWVTRTSTTPPTGDELFHGQRILLKGGGNIAAWTIGPNGPADANGDAVAVVADKVLELDRSGELTSGGNIWRVSDPPTQDDIITVLEDMEIQVFDGGVWKTGWDIEDHFNTSPLHPVRNIRYVTSPTGVANQAIEIQFNWDQISNLRFKESRGCWLNWWFPTPRLAGNGHTIGDVIQNGLIVQDGVLDSNNLDANSKGVIGWNRGVDSEDLGMISAISFKLRLRFEQASGQLVSSGWANLPMIFYAVDLFDHVYFFDFTIRRNDGWDAFTIPFGERAKRKLYFNRIDEVIEIPGITGWNPFGRFFFAEKEYTGATFDWRFVKMWGIQMKYGYDEANRYNNNFENSNVDLLGGALQYAINVPQNMFSPRPENETLVVKPDQSKIAISDLRFIKPLFVNSEETQVSDARTEITNQETEIDYQTAKLSAQGVRERRKFFPQTIHVRSFGDVRLRMGHRFILTGDKVPGGTQEMVVQSIKHIIDGSSYKMDIEAKRKFVLP